MGVANDVKKRWIKLYAQNLPGKEIPEEPGTVPSQFVPDVVPLPFRTSFPTSVLNGRFLPPILQLIGGSSNTQGLHLLFDSWAVSPFPFSGISPETVPKDFHTLNERRLAESGGEGQRKTTDWGREWLDGGNPKETGKKDERKEIKKDFRRLEPGVLYPLCFVCPWPAP